VNVQGINFQKVSKKHNNIKTFLDEYGHLQAIGINWRMFGSNGHQIKPPGGVIQNYTKSVFHDHIKSIVHRDVLLHTTFGCIHNVGGRCRRLDGTLIGSHLNTTDNTDIVCINHYFTKSLREFRAKCKRGMADNYLNRNPDDEQYQSTLKDEDLLYPTIEDRDIFKVIEKRK
jgi:hypothetical protein